MLPKLVGRWDLPLPDTFTSAGKRLVTVNLKVELP